jgi:hypothetical protein
MAYVWEKALNRRHSASPPRHVGATRQKRLKNWQKSPLKIDNAGLHSTLFDFVGFASVISL